MVLVALMGAQVVASECEYAHDPAPMSEAAGPITFFNDTEFAFRVLWIDYDGFLEEYALLQPGENTSIDTYVDHSWLVEVYTPEETVCVGPIQLADQEGCYMHILHDDGYFGFDANAACNF